MMALEKTVQAFASGTTVEYAFPADLTAEDRKTVKTIAEKLGLSSQSFGMGGERRIHIFKKKSENSPRSSDTGSTAESESHDPTEFISIKNSFLHFEETGARDPRIIQSMPNGKFAEGIKSDIAAAEAVQKGNHKKRPVPPPLSNNEEAETEMCSGTFFPPTPNAESPEMSFEVRNQASLVPTVQWIPSPMTAPPMTAPQLAATTVLPPAMLQQPFTAVLPPATLAPPPPPLPPTRMAPDSSTTILPPAIFSQGSLVQGSSPTVVLPPRAVPESSTTIVPPSMLARESSTTVLAPAIWASPSQATAPVSSSTAAAPLPMQPSATFVASAASTLTPTSAQSEAPVLASPQAGEEGPSRLIPGASVILHGLANQPAFNGLHGVISSFDAASGRYNISLEVAPNKRQLVKVKSQNLIPAHQLSVSLKSPGSDAQPQRRSSLTLDQML